MKKKPINQGKNSEVGYKKPPIDTRWKKGGPSPNPKGRPKSRTLSEAYRELLKQPLPNDPTRTYADVVAAALLKSACRGDVASARELADRTEGKPRQSIDLDVTTMDWRELARSNGLDVDDVIREARNIIESADAAGDAERAGETYIN